jgi:hypothetical protein
MDKGFAVLVLNACFRASREIGEVATMVEAHAPDDEASRLKSQMGMAVAEIGRVTESIYKMHPDLYDHVDAQIEKYGRLS